MTRGDTVCRAFGHEAQDRWPTGIQVCVRCDGTYDVAVDAARTGRFWRPALAVFVTCQVLALGWWFLAR